MRIKGEMKSKITKEIKEKLISFKNWKNKQSWLPKRSEIFKGIILWITTWLGLYFLAYICLSLVNWWIVKLVTDEQIIENIKKDMPTEDVEIKIFKEDLKWFWNDSIIVFTWIPDSLKQERKKALVKYYPKIIVYEVKEKSWIESLIYGNTLYKKVYEIQLSEPEIWQLTPGYSLERVQKIEIDDKKFFLFGWSEFKWANINHEYFWIFDYSFNDGYIIRPLFEWDNLLKIEGVDKDWENTSLLSLMYNEVWDKIPWWYLELFRNRTVDVTVNWKKSFSDLSIMAMWESDLYSSWNEIDALYSLWWYEWDGDHWGSHNMMNVQFDYVTNWLYPEKSFVLSNYKFIPKEDILNYYE